MLQIVLGMSVSDNPLTLNTYVVDMIEEVITPPGEEGILTEGGTFIMTEGAKFILTE